MRTTFDIKFYCRKSKVGKNGQAPIEMSVTINGDRTILSLPMKEEPNAFEKALSSKKNNQIKQYLAITEQNVKNAVTDIMDKGKAVTTSEVKQYLKYGGIKPYTIEDLFSDFMAVMKLRVGQGITERTYHKYEYIRDMFFEHIDKSLTVSHITNAVIVDFYSKLNERYEASSSGGMMTKLRTAIKYGIDNDKIKINPFSMVKISKGTPKKEFLTDEEMTVLMNRHFDIERLEHIKDLFLFQAASGLSYADVSELSFEDISFKDGIFFISKERVKTGQGFCAVVLPFGMDILRKYNGHLPLLSNQKYNSYLKEIQDLCGIEKKLHTHLARKTYATHMRRMGYNIATISRMLGHSNTTITESTYSFIEDNTVINEALRLQKSQGGSNLEVKCIEYQSYTEM